MQYGISNYSHHIVYHTLYILKLILTRSLYLLTSFTHFDYTTPHPHPATLATTNLYSVSRKNFQMLNNTVHLLKNLY